MCSRTLITTSTAPANVTGVIPPPSPLAVSLTVNIGTNIPNIFNSLIHRARSFVNMSGPVSDRLPPPRPASAPTTMLMSTNEFGAPTIVGAVC